MAAVDFIGVQSYVNRARIGVIGICGMGGMALNAVAAQFLVEYADYLWSANSRWGLCSGDQCSSRAH